jgi:CheY-like chemotaxis protein
MARILVVDDESALRRTLARYLVRLGHEVQEASDGQEALARVAVQAPDVLITDINMPDTDGIEVLAALRKQGSAVQVIAMSGGGLVDKRMLLDTAALLGAVVTLEKPFALDTLREAIDSILPK